MAQGPGCVSSDPPNLPLSAEGTPGLSLPRPPVGPGSIQQFPGRADAAADEAAAALPSTPCPSSTLPRVLTAHPAAHSAQLAAHSTHLAAHSSHCPAHGSHCPPPRRPLHCSSPQCLAHWPLLTTCDATLARATSAWAGQSLRSPGDTSGSLQPSRLTPAWQQFWGRGWGQRLQPSAQCSHIAKATAEPSEPPGTLNKQRVVTNTG